MTIDRSEEYLLGLIQKLCKLPYETEWVEFKHNKAEPEEIGGYLSALANAAALVGRVNAYLVWGVDDKTHEIVGTTFKPAAARVNNEELENWIVVIFEVISSQQSAIIRYYSWEKTTSYVRSMPTVAVRYCSNARYEPFPPFLYPQSDVARSE